MYGKVNNLAFLIGENMKKIIFLIISFIFIMNVNSLELNSKYSYIYNIKENKIMYENDSKKQIPVASLTKIMTAIIAIENNNDLEKEVTMINSDFRDMYEYAVAGFKVGDKVTVKDLLYGVLLPSGSDAVNAVVRVTTNTEEDFVKLMNEKVKELGLVNTHFSNPIGKDEGNYSSMYDIAQILEYALSNEIFKEIFMSSTYKVNNLTLKGPLSRTTDIISGAKTGFTYDAMYCLASFSEKDNFNYIVITAYADSYKEVIEDHINIYNYYYNNYSYHDYNVNFDVKIKNGKEEFYNVNIDRNYYLENNINKKLLTYKYEGIEEITKKIKKGDVLGKVSIYYNNELLDNIDIVLDKEIEYKNYYWVLIPTIFIILIVILLRKNKKR